MKSLWRTVRFSTWKDLAVLTDFWLRTTFLRADNSSQTFEGKILILRFRQWHIKTETLKWRLDNFPVFSDFSGLRAEVTFENKTPEFRILTSCAEIETFRLCLKTTFMNPFWILFWENFYNYMLRNIFSEDWKLKIIALIYGRFDLRVFCVELTLRFWKTFRILQAESAFRQSWKRLAESLFEANLRFTAESKTFENKLYDKTPNP